MNEIFNANCLDILPNIADASIDMINTDLPYGTTACKWDSVIPFNKHLYDSKGKAIYLNDYLLQCFKDGKNYADSLAYFNENCKLGLWDHYKRIIKPNGVIALTGSQPFTTDLINSNREMFKYEWIYEKTKAPNYLFAKKQPMKYHENIAIFYKEQPTYNPQMLKGLPYKRIHRNGNKITSPYAKDTRKNGDFIENKGFRYPSNIIRFKNKSGRGQLHGTQKPIALYEYLIKTYTNEGDLVLDTCAGSFTTAVACLNTKRNYICIEQDPAYFDLGSQRIAKTLKANSEKLFV